MHRSTIRLAAFLTAASLSLAACGGGGSAASSPAAAPSTAASASSAPASASTSASASGSAGASASSSASASGSASASASGSAAPSGSSSAAASSSPLPHVGGTVSFIGSWGGEEQNSFMAEVGPGSPFFQQTGITVQYTGTRDLSSILTTRVQAGNPPDVAGLPGPAQMAQFAQAGKMVDVSTFLDMNTLKSQYAGNWIQLGTVNGKLVGVFMKADLKSSVWYDPKNFDKVSGGTPPKTWDDLTSLSNKIAATGTTPWCIGLESAATSGWPGTDWISDIMMRTAGPTAYQQWYNGQLPWTSQQVKNAWQMFGTFATNPKMTYGGAQYELSTNFANSGMPMFKSPPGCYMERQGDFITGNYTSNDPNLKPVTDFNYFPFPEINSQYAGVDQVSGDLIGVFKDTPQSRALIQYLVTPEAQSIWVKRGGALSPNKGVPLSDYPDPLSKQLAQTLTTAQTPLFSAGDMMPPPMQSAFYKGVLNYVQNPGQLDSILQGLDQTQKTAYASSAASGASTGASASGSAAGGASASPSASAGASGSSAASASGSPSASASASS